MTATSSYLNLPRRSLADVIRDSAAVPVSPKLRISFKTLDGIPVTAVLWNPNCESVAQFCECEESEVRFVETDMGDVVTVRGEVVGKIEG